MCPFMQYEYKNKNKNKPSGLFQMCLDQNSGKILSRMCLFWQAAPCWELL